MANVMLEPRRKKSVDFTILHQDQRDAYDDHEEVDHYDGQTPVRLLKRMRQQPAPIPRWTPKQVVDGTFRIYCVKRMKRTSNMRSLHLKHESSAD
jgi:hypothetical protein